MKTLTDRMKENSHSSSSKMEGLRHSVEKVKVTIPVNSDGSDKENSFIKGRKRDAGRAEHSGYVVQDPHDFKTHKKKPRRGIYISYSPDAGYLERRFVSETVRQFKENNLAEDIWFDKDEKVTDKPAWFSLRMEAVERCRAAVLFLTDSYFTCPVSIYESKILLERHRVDNTSIRLYPVLFSLKTSPDISPEFSDLLAQAVDMTTSGHAKLSLAEKTSIVIGTLMTDLERHASVHAPPAPFTPPDMEFNGEYKKKKICQWSVHNLQEWLFDLGIKEFYRLSMAENMVDGFLLMALTDQDMVQHLGIDSRVVRRKLMQQILVTLDKEHRLAENWHLRARTQRAKPNVVYLVYDPADARLAQNIKADLMKKNLQVSHHESLGQSKEEYLRLNAPQISCASHVVIIQTGAVADSLYTFHEILFADWLGKKMTVAMFTNTWSHLRPSLRAVLGDCPSVDFATKMYHESLEILEHHIKPQRALPGIVLEQSYLDKMVDGLKPLSVLATTVVSQNKGPSQSEPVSKNPAPTVFISYQWDMQARVEELRHTLEMNGFTCWADINPTPTLQRGYSNLSLRGGGGGMGDTGTETLRGQIHRVMRGASVVVTCITPKYMQSDNCVKDLTLADILHKTILPVMLRYSPWPPECASSKVRKVLARHQPIDLSNDKLFKQNLHIVVEKVKRTTIGR